MKTELMLLDTVSNINAGLNVSAADIDAFRNNAQQACPSYANFGASLPQGITTTTDAAATALSTSDLD